MATLQRVRRRECFLLLYEWYGWTVMKEDHRKEYTLEYFVPYLLLGQRWNGYRIPIVIQLGSNRFYKAVLV
jgi:hypothetical protein